MSLFVFFSVCSQVSGSYLPLNFNCVCVFAQPFRTYITYQYQQISKMIDEEKSISPSPVEKGSVTDLGADKALEFLRLQAQNSSFVDVDEKKLLRKIDWMIIP
jgi:hypothetical protein